VWGFLKTPNTDLLCDLTSGYISKGYEGSMPKRHYYMLIAVLYTIANIWNQSRCPLMEE
jgi:hypothetical protein